MANEISFSFTLAVTSGTGATQRKRTASTDSTVQYNQTGTNSTGGVQNIGFAAAENLQLDASVGTEGWAYFHNLDATNYVRVGYDNTGFVPFVRLLAGEWAVFPLEPGLTYQAQADTGAVDLEYEIFER